MEKGTGSFVPPSPPLFVRMSNHKWLLESCIVDAEGGTAADVVGERICEVRAPNGACAQGEVLFDVGEEPKARYLKLASLVLRKIVTPTDDLCDLLIEPGLNKHEGPFEPVDPPSLDLWSGGRCLDPDEWSSSTSGEGMAKALRLSTTVDIVDNIRMWTAGGPSIVVRWPMAGKLSIILSKSRIGDIFRPLVAGSPSKVSAFWGFLRHDCVDAAAALGEQLASEAIESSDCDEALIAAAHWAVRFGGNDELRLQVRHALASSKREDADAVALNWLLDVELAPERSLDETAKAKGFRLTLAAIHRTGPLYTETLRLVTERLSAGYASCLKAGTAEEVATEVDWIRSLSSSAYWDSEYTSYRALEPGKPDPTALGSAPPAAARKK